MKKYEELSYLSQVRLLRKLAHLALQKYPIGRYDLKFIHHGENTTFKVTTKKKSYLLRVHRHLYHSKQSLKEELQWLSHLEGRIPFQTPAPQKNKSGQRLSLIKSKELGLERFCSLMSWTQGRILSNKTPEHYFQVGKLISTLQSNPIKIKARNYWLSDGLLGKKASLGSISALKEELSQPSFDKLNELRLKLYKKIKSYEKRKPQKTGLIHADLHFGNMIWSKGIPSPIDFDDCGRGFYLYDLAVVLYSQQKFLSSKNKIEKEQYINALYEGYRSFQNLDDDDIKMLPYFVLVRKVAMFGWLYSRRDNPRLYAYFKKVIRKDIEKVFKEFKKLEQKK